MRSDHASGALLVAYRAGELTGPARMRTEAHLQRCARCRDEVASLEAVGQLLRTTSSLTVDPAGLVRVQARLAQERAAPRAAAGLQRWLYLGLIVVALSAAVWWPLWCGLVVGNKPHHRSGALRCS